MLIKCSQPTSITTFSVTEQNESSKRSATIKMKDGEFLSVVYKLECSPHNFEDWQFLGVLSKIVEEIVTHGRPAHEKYVALAPEKESSIISKIKGNSGLEVKFGTKSDGSEFYDGN